MKGLKKISTRIFIGILAGTLIIFSLSTLIDFVYSKKVLTRLVRIVAERSFNNAYNELNSEIRPIINNAQNTAYFLSYFNFTQKDIFKIQQETINRFSSIYGCSFVYHQKSADIIYSRSLFKNNDDYTDLDFCDSSLFKQTIVEPAEFPYSIHLKNDTVIFSYSLQGDLANTCIQYYASLAYFVNILDKQINIDENHYYLFDGENNIIESSTTYFSKVPEDIRESDISFINLCLGQNMSGLITPEESGTDKAIYLLKLKGTDLTIVTIFPIDQVLKKFRGYFLVSFLIRLIIIFVLAYVLRRIIVRVMKPISELITLSKKIQNGSLNTEIPDYYKDGETAQLSDTLRTMQGRMKRYVTDFNSTLKEKRALEHELHIASIIQAEMLPKPLRALTEIPDIDIYARMIPAKGVAGDFYDYFFLDDYRLFFILGDVSGKGIPAAMFMARIITMIQIESRKEDSPGKVFSAVNNYLTLKNDEGMFVTAIGGVIDITSGELILCDAGHNTPLMSFNSDDYEYKVLEKNTPLGILPDLEYKETALKLEKTDSIIIYSDGLTEAQSKSGKLLGEQTVKDTLITKGKVEVDVLANLLWNLIESFTINAPQSDDITLLILRYFGKEK